MNRAASPRERGPRHSARWNIRAGEGTETAEGSCPPLGDGRGQVTSTDTTRRPLTVKGFAGLSPAASRDAMSQHYWEREPSDHVHVLSLAIDRGIQLEVDGSRRRSRRSTGRRGERRGSGRASSMRASPSRRGAISIDDARCSAPVLVDAIAADLVRTATAARRSRRWTCRVLARLAWVGSREPNAVAPRCRCGRSGQSHFFTVRWWRSILPWVWSWYGLRCVKVIPREASSIPVPVWLPRWAQV